MLRRAPPVVALIVDAMQLDLMYILVLVFSSIDALLLDATDADIDVYLLYQHHRSIILIVTIQSYGGKRSSRCSYNRSHVMYDVHRKSRSLSPSVGEEPKPLHPLNLSQSLQHQTALFRVVEMVRSPIAGGSLDIIV